MSQRLVQQLAKEALPLVHVCRVLGLSRSGVYAATARPAASPSAVLPHLKAAFAASGQTYGSRRLVTELQRRGHALGRTRVRRLMQRHGLQACWKRKFVHTTDSRHDLPVADNLLNRRFNPSAPNRVWVADITYLRTRSGWLYLAAVLDLYSRKLVGWAMAPHMRTELVCSALRMAISQRNPKPGLMVHSDRGSQYASGDYQALLQCHGLVGSMSRRGNCWDNAVMERFFLNLKMERVWRADYANHAEARRDVTDYIVAFYNNVRLHSKLGNRPPSQYETDMMAPKQPIYLSEIP